MIRPILIALLAALPLPLSAQDKNAAEVEFRVTRFDPGDQPPPAFRVGGGAGRLDITVPLTHIGGPHKAGLREGRFLDFFRGDNEKPEISLTIAEGERKDLLLFFFPVGESFKVMKVHTPPGRIRGGDRHLLNVTGSRLAVKIGDAKPVYIDPGKSGLLRGPGGDEPLSLPILINIREGEKWKPASTENWHFDPRFRGYLFAFISPRTRHLAFHVVSERMEVLPEAIR